MLAVTQLVGFGGRIAAPPPSLTFLQATADPTPATTFTFAGQNFGAADPTRRIIVVAHAIDSITAFTFTSITIGGIAATIHVDGGSSASNIAIASALVPAGTSGSIVVNLSGGTPDRCAIAVYRAINETSASPHATLLDTSISSGVFSGTINIPADGWVIAGTQPSGGVSHTGAAWSGVTEQYDNAHASSTFRYSGGFASALAAQANRPISSTESAGTLPSSGRMAAISWG